jgi:hypothetical protein
VEKSQGWAERVYREREEWVLWRERVIGCVMGERGW